MYQRDYTHGKALILKVIYCEKYIRNFETKLHP